MNNYFLRLAQRSGMRPESTASHETARSVYASAIEEEHIEAVASPSADAEPARASDGAAVRPRAAQSVPSEHERDIAPPGITGMEAPFPDYHEGTDTPLPSALPGHWEETRTQAGDLAPQPPLLRVDAPPPLAEAERERPMLLGTAVERRSQSERGGAPRPLSRATARPPSSPGTAPVDPIFDIESRGESVAAPVSSDETAQAAPRVLRHAPDRMNRDRALPHTGAPVEIRIGSVTLEVKASEPASPPPPPPPPAHADVFEPHRYYLRRW